MAVRVTSEEVLGIMDGPDVSETVVTKIIKASNLIINSKFSGKDVSDDILFQLELWFAAHMIASGPGRSVLEEKVDDATLRYTGKYGEGLKATPYGQMVLTLDPLGVMANAGKMGATINVLKQDWE